MTGARRPVNYSPWRAACLAGKGPSLFCDPTVTRRGPTKTAGFINWEKEVKLRTQNAARVIPSVNSLERGGEENRKNRDPRNRNGGKKKGKNRGESL